MRELNYLLKQICNRNRDGGESTQASRERGLSLMANKLHELGFKHMTPRSLKAKHINALLEHWQKNKITPGTIKTRMSYIRWWAEKVGKSHIIPRSNDALELERRVYVTNESKARDLTPELLDKISNERVKISLELQHAFGLRTEESLKFRPVIADKGDHIWLKGSWCKGGQARSIPILHQYQRELLDRAHLIAKRGSMIPNDLTYIAQLNVYKSECYRAGLSKMHGHRHAYAQRRYLEITGWPAPAAGGLTNDQLSPEQKELDYQARMVISEELGHHREDVTAVYLGR